MSALRKHFLCLRVRLFVNPLEKAVLLLFIFVILGGMTSCLGVNADIVLNADNSGTLNLEYRISHILDSLGRLEGNEGRPTIPVGRLDFQRTVDRIPGMRLLSFNSREDTRDRIITARLQFSNIDALLSFLDAAGEKAVYYTRGDSQMLSFTLNQGGRPRNPEMDALIAQISQGYNVNINMTIASGEISAALNAMGPGVEIRSQGRRASASLPLGFILSAENPLNLEFRW